MAGHYPRPRPGQQPCREPGADAPAPRPTRQDAEPGTARGGPEVDERLAALPLLPTTLVGSWSQPRWLIDKDDLDSRLPVRVERHSLWRVDDELLAEAQADATRVAVLEQVALGLDIVTDGEIRRESYSNRFVNALDGIDHERPGERLDRTGKVVPVPRVAGPLQRVAPVEADIVAVVRAVTDRPIKITVPGPFTMTQQAQNDHYRSD